MIDAGNSNELLVETGSVFPSKGIYLWRISGHPSKTIKLIIN
jgi:hypothetical protein